jgi:1-acyl-sn-glycerol-3-phosphate acyltransferase
MKQFRFSWFDWFCFWYPPGWLILFNRHWQHYHDDPDGWNWLEYLLFLIPVGFYLALLMRWTRLGFRSPRSPITDPDPTYQRIFREEILTPIVTRYFRAELHHWENLPDEPPAIVALNHAGMCFPWDFISLGFLLSQEKGWFVQPLAHPIFFDHPWLVWWLPPGWTKVLGCVRAERASFEVAVAQKSVVLYAPESWRGLAKGWQQRYQLERFDPSFVRLSLHHHVPILPTLCLGNEYLHPWTVNSKKLARWLKMPLLPVSPLLLLFVLFPSLGVWAVRTKLRYYLQSLHCPWKALIKEHHSERSYAYQQAEILRETLQEELQHLVSDA